ncbi:MAG TPA: Lrp/AsnC family transcriptional regulator [Sphingobacteriaceae bacterium]|nr:Lrp/AsnC family transcriptional regulator [Sphingobacteriaceae bacterium]
MVQLDRTEKEIIRSLQKDGRMSFVDMAERVGVTEGTIRRKFYRLVEEGVLQIGAITDPFMVGFKTPAVIGLNVDTDRIGEVVKALAAVPRIRQLMLTTGIFDIILVGYFSSNRELARFITDELSRIEGITDTNTSVVLEIYKDSFEVGLPANTGDDE